MALKEDFNPNLSTKVQAHTATGHNAVANAINNSVLDGTETTPAATAVSLAAMIGQLRQRFKSLFGSSDWFTETQLPTASLQDGAITQEKVANDAIGVNEIIDDSITQAKTFNDGLVPAGAVNAYAGSSAPTGWLLCDGSSLLRSSYSDLFTAIGTTYGAADGTHFTLPNLKGKVPVGFNSSETEFDTLGETGGAKTHTLTTAEIASHNHTQDAHGHGVTDPQHTHSWKSGSGSNAGGGASPYARNDAGFETSAANTSSSTGLTVNNATATNQATGGGGSHNNLQPYIALNYIIKT